MMEESSVSGVQMFLGMDDTWQRKSTFPVKIIACMVLMNILPCAGFYCDFEIHQKSLYDCGCPWTSKGFKSITPEEHRYESRWYPRRDQTQNSTQGKLFQVLIIVKKHLHLFFSVLNALLFIFN